jgi:hypothetical protein
MMLKILRSLANTSDGWEYASSKQVRVVNILIRHFTHDREKKLELLSRWFDRTITTSAKLTMEEASALIECGYDTSDNDSWTILPEFEAFMLYELEEETDSDW